MAARVCVECTTVYAVGAPRCPHCQSADSIEQGEPMPKITVHGGPSDFVATWADNDEPDEWRTPETAGAAADTPAAAAPAPEGGDQPSPGNSSAPSTEKPQPGSKQSAPARRKRARTTANRSTSAPTDDSTAPSTDGEATDNSATD